MLRAQTYSRPAAMIDAGPVRYARVGDSHIAYRVMGEGPPDAANFMTGQLLVVNGGYVLH